MSVQLCDRINILDFPAQDKISFESLTLLDTMEDYVNGTIIQWNRIQSTIMKSHANLEKKRKRAILEGKRRDI